MSIPMVAWAQADPVLQSILERLHKLEEQNRQLSEEVRQLRNLLSAKEEPGIQDRVAVQEHRTEELAQAKVEAASRTPVSLTGMILFNAFYNSRFSGAQDNPTTASLLPVPRTAGATLRQTVIGLEVHSPRTVLGANVNGAVFMDFFANPVSTFGTQRAVSSNLSRLMRLRIATLELDWGSTKLLLGQDKPIFSPREPNSLAQVGVSPLTGAGNPWLWQPQARLEQKIGLGGGTDLRAQIGVFQTSEQGAIVPAGFESTLESSRPGLEGRFAFEHSFGDNRHIEIAPGFHASTTHVAGASVPSRVYSVDWSIAPFSKLTLSGLFFAGKNTANLGTLRQGFVVRDFRDVRPVRSVGGWAQLSYVVLPRVTLNLYGGEHDDLNRDLTPGSIGRNLAYAGNALYRIAPNVIMGFEAMQVRTTYLQSGTRLNNHYDLSLAYQF